MRSSNFYKKLEDEIKLFRHALLFEFREKIVDDNSEELLETHFVSNDALLIVVLEKGIKTNVDPDLGDIILLELD